MEAFELVNLMTVIYWRWFLFVIKFVTPDACCVRHMPTVRQFWFNPIAVFSLKSNPVSAGIWRCLVFPCCHCGLFSFLTGQPLFDVCCSFIHIDVACRDCANSAIPFAFVVLVFLYIVVVVVVLFVLATVKALQRCHHAEQLRSPLFCLTLSYATGKSVLYL